MAKTPAERHRAAGRALWNLATLQQATVVANRISSLGLVVDIGA
jgi:hypothetical protein